VNKFHSFWNELTGIHLFFQTNSGTSESKIHPEDLRIIKTGIFSFHFTGKFIKKQIIFSI